MVQSETNRRSRIGHQYDRISSAFEPSNHMAEDIFRLALRGDEPRDLRVLDAGCGLGPTSVAFGRREAALVVGVDLSHGSLAKGHGAARALGLSNVHFQQMDLYNLGLVTGSFDLVFCQAVWPLVPDKRGVVEELTRVCRPGGTVIVSFHAKTWIDPIVNAIRVAGCRLPQTLHMPLSRLASRLYKGIEGLLRRRNAALHEDKAPEQTFYEIFFAPTPMRWPDPRELLGLLRQQGLVVEDVAVTGVLGKNERIYRATKPREEHATIGSSGTRMAGAAERK